MAKTDYPLLTRKRIVAAKVESTVGTAASLTAAEAAYNFFDAKIVPNIDYAERPGQGGFSPLPGVLAGLKGTFTGRIELFASGTPESSGGESVPAWAKVLLPALGIIQSGAISPIFKPSSLSPAGGSDALGPRTITIGLFQDGKFVGLSGCMGNAVFTFAAGKVVAIDLTYQGVYVAPTDVALIAPTYPAPDPLHFESAAMTLGSLTPLVDTMRIDLGNTLVMREDANQASGYLNALITGRRINGTMNPEAKLKADYDAEGIWLARTTQALAFSCGTVAGKKCSFAAPALSFTNVQQGDRNGSVTNEIAFQLNRSASAGDDEFTITFG